MELRHPQPVTDRPSLPHSLIRMRLKPGTARRGWASLRWSEEQFPWVATGRLVAAGFIDPILAGRLVLTRSFPSAEGQSTSSWWPWPPSLLPGHSNGPEGREGACGTIRFSHDHSSRFVVPPSRRRCSVSDDDVATVVAHGPTLVGDVASAVTSTVTPGFFPKNHAHDDPDGVVTVTTALRQFPGGSSQFRRRILPRHSTTLSCRHCPVGPGVRPPFDGGSHSLHRSRRL